MKQRRDLLILLALFVALVVFTILGPGNARDETPSSGPTTYSSGPNGALALLRWTQAMGYDARRLEFRAFDVDEETAVLFILSPSQTINRTQTDTVLQWVETGGTLILAEDRVFGGGGEILRELEINVRGYEDPNNENLFDEIERAPVLQPALNTPPLREAVVRTSGVLETKRNDVTALAGLPEQPVLMGLKRGDGYIYISSAVYPFTNEGLKNEQNAALLLNLLRRAPEGGQILFDEFHHGFFEPPSLRSIIFSNAWGWALVYALAIIVAYFVLTGRRFGQPVPLREELARRSSAEYVESMADLFQRGGKRDFVRNHYTTAFKRRLARPYGINPQIDDAAFVAELARYRDVDQSALNRLLARLRRSNIGEDELLRLVAETDAAGGKRNT